MHASAGRILTSSRREGRILRVRRPSENLSRTLVRPFINEIFSSRVFAAKFERSRKLSVDTTNDEKNGCRGRSDGLGLLCGCRLMRALRSAVNGMSLVPERSIMRRGYL